MNTTPSHPVSSALHEHAVKRLLLRFERELERNPTLVEAIIARPEVFPPIPAQPEPVLIRTDEASVEKALARALAVAAAGAAVKLRLEAS